MYKIIKNIKKHEKHQKGGSRGGPKKGQKKGQKTAFLGGLPSRDLQKRLFFDPFSGPWPYP